MALAGPRHEAHDLAPPQLVERRPAGDLVQPGAGAVVVLERVEGAERLDEGFLGQVGRQFVVAQHAREIGIDLRMM